MPTNNSSILQTSRKRGRRKPLTVPASDLFLPIPRSGVTASSSSSSSSRSVLVQELSQRLVAAGYQQAAFAHTIFGKPKDPDDRVDTVLCREKTLLLSPTHPHASACAPGLCVWRRLHAVLENLSDVAYFTNQSTTAVETKILNEYDIVSIAPRNEAVLRAVLESANMCDIVTLDYYSTGLRSGLPFRIRAAHVRTAQERKVVLEIPYAPAVLSQQQQQSCRKAWIQVAAELQQASRGLKPVILCTSSGDRKVVSQDAVAVAIRTPRDVQNLAQTVLGLNGTRISSAAQFAMARANQRRFGANFIQSVEHSTGKTIVDKQPSKTTTKKKKTEIKTESESRQDGNEGPAVKKKKLDSDKTVASRVQDAANAEEDDAGDGFISF